MKSVASVDSVESLGFTVRRTRKIQGLTQEELARESGVSRSFIIDLEDGHPRAELGKVLAVLKTLAVSLAALTPGSGSGAEQATLGKQESETPANAFLIPPKHRIQFSISQQRLARERRARNLAGIMEGWSEGRDIPDAETQRIVRAYIEGALSLDEAMTKIKKLSSVGQ